MKKIKIQQNQKIKWFWEKTKYGSKLIEIWGKWKNWNKQHSKK